jgi:hypothetical protein
VVLYEGPCISTRGHSGGSVTPRPVALMSYPWAQSGSPYRAQSMRFSSSVRISTFFEANPTAATGPVLIPWGLVWGSGSRGVCRVNRWQHLQRTPPARPPTASTCLQPAHPHAATSPDHRQQRLPRKLLTCWPPSAPVPLVVLC